MDSASGVGNGVVNLRSVIENASIKLGKEAAHDGVGLESRKRKAKRKRRKLQNQLGNDSNLVDNILQVDQDVDHSRYPDSCTTTKVRTPAVNRETRSDVRLKAEHRGGNEISRERVIEKADPINGSLGIEEQDATCNGVSPGSRETRKRKRKGQDTMGDGTNLVKNINQVTPDVEHSMYPNSCPTTMVQSPTIITEADSDVRQKAERESLLESLEQPAAGNESSRGVVIKKVDPINEFLGIDHANVISNLSLIPVSDGLKGVELKKKKKKKARSQASGSVVREESSIGTSLNDSQVNQDEHSLYPNTCTTTMGPTPAIITEVDSNVSLKAADQDLHNPLKRTTDSGNESSRGMVIKKVDPINGFLGIDHTKILSNLSLVNVPEGLKGVNSKKKKKKKKKKKQEASGSVGGVSNGANLCSFPRSLANLSPKGKLLVLDINGLLADIVVPPPKDRTADNRINGRAIFKRPFYHEFLVFCFERFDVGIWSSRSKKVVDNVVNYLLGEMKQNLLFCWNMLHCTQTSFKTLENKHKPLVFKELKKLWEKDDPYLPWEKGDYNESNTLLIDDSPYKALLNPIHTAIFPCSFHYKDKSDKSLGMFFLSFM
ncbi:OLC1v1009774C4 [Oldenlandia corymbosa var. corymbosa]|uniref:OLC1v1009774C4 n=1 Tax=Oldenlandia corymbosa var. corymbosa TaxID=529605 RepID=A0AAV1DSC3_OLDCO|nr:OLC1v1009774C4 [Oldenlandia corymbosa var. corymbosa]